MMETFDQWWERSGRFLDHDTSDVSWFDKRRELAAAAFESAKAQSCNYIADDDIDAVQVVFANGRRVTVKEDGTLAVDYVEQK